MCLIAQNHKNLNVLAPFSNLHTHLAKTSTINELDRQTTDERANIESLERENRANPDIPALNRPPHGPDGPERLDGMGRMMP